MRIITGWVTSIFFLALGVSVPTQASAPTTIDKPPIQAVPSITNLVTPSLHDHKSVPKILFSHGSIDWLPELALEAGWPEETHEKLGQIVLRESGGCPNRKGGDMVNKNCYITGVSEWNHRSDTGLLQINGVNYNPKRNKWAIACRVMKICTQDPLLDPVTNLRVGYLMYQDSGWDPWDACTWDKTKCPKDKKP